MANDKVVKLQEGTKEERGLGKTGSFKPSAPAGYVRPKAVPVPAKTK